MRRTVATIFAGILLVSGCGADDEPDASAETAPAPTTTPETESSEAPTTAPPTESPRLAPTSEPPSPEPTEEAADGTVVTTGDSEFGEMLFDVNDQAIYMFDVESTATPECYDDCAIAWPPVLTDGAPQAAGNIDPGLLGTTERSDGTTQVTYNDHPLYYYANEAPGEVKCHNVDLNGGLWYVLQPNGNPAPPG